MKNFALILFSIIIFSCQQSKTQQAERNIYDRDNIDKKVLLEKIGETYYQKKCVECHGNRNAKDNFLVNAIVFERYDFKFFKDFINNQDRLLKSNDSTALSLNEKYNKSDYRHNFKFTDHELKSLMFYLKN